MFSVSWNRNSVHSWNWHQDTITIQIAGYLAWLWWMQSVNLTHIDLSHKYDNPPVPYPTMHHFVTEVCSRVHISVMKWCTVGYLMHCGMGETNLFNSNSLHTDCQPSCRICHLNKISVEWCTNDLGWRHWIGSCVFLQSPIWQLIILWGHNILWL